MTVTLNTIPGFADVADTSFAAEKIALGIQIAKISDNAAFGIVRLEMFKGYYKSGDTVALPVSAVDGYNYGRDELLYAWAVHNTTDPNTGWITGPDSLWYAAWKVDQVTGVVTTQEWYKTSVKNGNPANSQDGTLEVFTIAQRRLNTLTMASTPSPYNFQNDTVIQAEDALQTTALTRISRAAKYGVCKCEIIYMGEFVDGDTIAQPVSPIDGYTYAYSEVAFQHCWRWTTLGTNYIQPDNATGQLAPIACSINATTGAVTITVKYVDTSANLNTMSGFGRVAVFAICRRTIHGGAGDSGSLTDGHVRDNFAEIDESEFMPGSPMAGHLIQQLNENIRQAAYSPEVFGPFTKGDGDTISLPTSLIDGYTYARNELFYIWEWSDTTNQTGTHLRTPLWYGDIDQSTGTVTLAAWRLAAGGPILDDNNTLCRIRVTVIATRKITHTVVTGSTTNAPSDAGSAQADILPSFSVNGS